AERIALVEPPDRPLAGLRIERAKRHPAPRARRGVEDVVLDVREAAPDLVVGAGALELDPLLLSVGQLLQGPGVDLPGPDLEVEAVSAGVLRFLGLLVTGDHEHHCSDRSRERHRAPFRFAVFCPGFWSGRQASAWGTDQTSSSTRTDPGHARLTT